jgi:hypothetical protein
MAYPAIGQDCKYICLHFGSHDLNLEIRDEASASETLTTVKSLSMGTTRHFDNSRRAWVLGAIEEDRKLLRREI